MDGLQHLKDVTELITYCYTIKDRNKKEEAVQPPQIIIHSIGDTNEQRTINNHIHYHFYLNNNQENGVNL